MTKPYKAWRVVWLGFPSVTYIVAAQARGKATTTMLHSIWDANYDAHHGQMRTLRAPEFDELAGKAERSTARERTLGWHDSEAGEAWGCLAPTKPWTERLDAEIERVMA